MKYNEYGEELPDDTPLEAPVRFRRPPSIQELIAMHVRSAMQVERAMGSNDDEEDFEEGSEVDDILTPYELHAYAGEADVELRRAKESKEVVDRLSKGKDNNNEKGGSADGRVRRSPDVAGAEGVGRSGESVKAVGESIEGAAGSDSGKAKGAIDGARGS